MKYINRSVVAGYVLMIYRWEWGGGSLESPAIEKSTVYNAMGITASEYDELENGTLNPWPHETSQLNPGFGVLWSNVWEWYGKTDTMINNLSIYPELTFLSNGDFETVEGENNLNANQLASLIEGVAIGTGNLGGEDLYPPEPEPEPDPDPIPDPTPDPDPVDNDLIAIRSSPEENEELFNQMY